MIYCFDLDGTLCNTNGRDYKNSEPLSDRIKAVNKLYSEGNEIIIYTSRGMKTFNGNEKKCYEEYYYLTLEQLKKWKVIRRISPSGRIY